jgi:hypothetical protein
MKTIALVCVFLLFFLPVYFAGQLQWNFSTCNNDGTCDSGEDKCTCPNDCGTCSGDVPGEVCQEYSCLTGLCRPQIKYYCCGNHICEAGEDFSNCDADCAPTKITIELLSPSDSNIFLRGDEITFKAKVKADGVPAKKANVRVRTFAGDIPMYDDGNHSDEKANDGIYAVSFLVSELTAKNNYPSEIYAEKLGVTETLNFIVKVDPSLSMEFSTDKNTYVLGEIISFKGKLLKRGNPLSTVITVAAFNKEKKVFESKTRSDENGFFYLEQRTSLIYPEGKWKLQVSGEDSFDNIGLMEKTVVVSKEPGTIFMDVVFSSGYREFYERGEEIKALVDVLFNDEPIENAEVKALFPDGKEIPMKMVSKGKYSLSYLLPFDFPLGEQTILINARKEIGSVKYGGSTEMKITVDNAKINAVLLEPAKQTLALGEELTFKLKFSYGNGEPLIKGKVWIKINDKNVKAIEKEQGTFYFSYVVKKEDLFEAKQVLLNAKAVDAFGNKVNFSRLFEVKEDLTLEYYFRENPLLFLSVIFSFVFIVVVVIVIRNRMNKLSSLYKRKKELEKLKSDLQEKYFNLGSISNEQYYSLLSKYGAELRDIESAIESFKKLEKKEDLEDDVFKKKNAFEDSEMDSMFSVKKKKLTEEEEVPGLFTLKKKPKKEKEKYENADNLWEEEKETKKIKKEGKQKKEEEEDDLWK